MNREINVFLAIITMISKSNKRNNDKKVIRLKKILVLFTGGTIGSMKKEKSIDVDESTSAHLIEQYKCSPYAQDVEFELHQPLHLLSENIIPEDWHRFIAFINKFPLEQYEGVIVTHGSDTLPFTSACLSYAFRHSPVPIVLTASNYPLHHPKSRGLRNFAGSVDFILDQALPGIFVCFENEHGEMTIYLGTRLMEALPFTDEYAATYAIPFGRIVQQRFVRNNHEINPSIAGVRAKREPLPFLDRLKFSSEIMYIKPHPGLDYRYFMFSEHKPKAVLHDLYHSGTASTRGEAMFSLRTFIQHCRQHGIKLYMSPIKNASGDLYASSVELIEAGAVPIENTSVPASLVKLMLAYGTFSAADEIDRFLQGPPLFFESHAVSNE